MPLSSLYFVYASRSESSKNAEFWGRPPSRELDLGRSQLALSLLTRFPKLSCSPSSAHAVLHHDVTVAPLSPSSGHVRH